MSIDILNSQIHSLKLFNKKSGLVSFKIVRTKAIRLCRDKYSSVLTFESLKDYSNNFC